MNKIKKILVVLLIMVLGVTNLSGCGGAGDSKGRDTAGKTEVKVGYWLSGMGEQWLIDMIDAFEKQSDKYYVNYTTYASSAAMTTSLGLADMDEIDLYLGMKTDAIEHLEPLDGVLDTTIDGEEKTIKEKFNSNYLAYERSNDDHYYTLTYGGGMLNLYYNTELFETAGVTQLPRTTDELTVLCDSLNSQGYSQGVAPLCHFQNGGYYEYMLQLYTAQYNGIDYWLNNFLACTDKEGNSPSQSILSGKDGRYYALKAMEKFITPTYTMSGSTTLSHTESQTMFLNEAAFMMLNGSWIENEMKMNEGDYNLGAMKVPVLSAIINQLSTVKNDATLRELITAIDEVTEGKKELSDFASGDAYIVNGVTISAEDWDKVTVARNMVQCNYAQSSAFVPNYSSEKEGALEFLKFMYSDEGYKIYAAATNCPLPMELSTGESIDTSKMSETEQTQFALISPETSFVDMGASTKHKIFTAGGASIMAGINYVDKFSAANKDDRMNAEEVWKLLEQTVGEKYPNTWLPNIQ